MKKLTVDLHLHTKPKHCRNIRKARFVIPARAGIQASTKALDARLRGHDGREPPMESKNTQGIPFQVCLQKGLAKIANRFFATMRSYPLRKKWGKVEMFFHFSPFCSLFSQDPCRQIRHKFPNKSQNI
jgi:hypothetical protein